MNESDDVRLLEIRALFADFLPDGTEQEIGRVAAIQSDLDWARLRLEGLLVRGIVSSDEYARAVNAEATWAMRECAVVLGRARCEQLFGEDAQDATSEVITETVDTDDLQPRVKDPFPVNVRETAPADVAGILSQHDGDDFEALACASQSWNTVLEALKRLAPIDVPVLLVGETGTGKETLARAVHRASPRAGKPFVGVSCAAMSDMLIESELFGHERGAFTGASEMKRGRFELADHGTLFLDNVGDLPFAAQAKLLMALQDKEIQRVGGTKRIVVDVRVIATADATLRTRVDEGRFREDLFYRLNVLSVAVPPLRERREDIPLLAERLARRAASAMGRTFHPLPPAVTRVLQDYDWPGNIRQLEYVIERAVMLSPGGEISVRDLRIEGSPQRISVAAQSLEAVERELILKALETARGRIAGKDGAAERLGLTPGTLRARLRRLGLTRHEPGEA